MAHWKGPLRISKRNLDREINEISLMIKINLMEINDVNNSQIISGYIQRQLIGDIHVTNLSLKRRLKELKAKEKIISCA